MKLTCTMLALLLLAPVGASAQPADLAGDLTGYTRFVVYPHLQRGWASLKRGERDRALAEFEHARGLAPENAGVALQLAAAYRTFGQPARAESVLLAQQTLTPNDGRLRTAIADLRLAGRAPTGASPATGCGGPGAEACPPPVPERPLVRTPPLTARRSGAGAVTRKAGGTALPPARPYPADPIPHDVSAAPPSDASSQVRTGFVMALAAHRFDDAERHASALLEGESSGVGLLDELTYKLVDAGATMVATRTLLRAYPFAAGGPAERDTLLQRLTMLVEQQRPKLDDQQLRPLREPLDTPALRSRQGALWTNLQECATTRAVLGDMSAEYGHDDWMRLGDCSTVDAPGVAQQAYARAQALQSGGRASRALAFQAFAAKDYQAALAAWRSAEPGLSEDEWLAAATTALAAGEREQAASWLRSFRKGGTALSYRYWSLVAETHSGRDTAAVVEALEHAVELQPEADDYLHLARLESDAGRQVRWLESAAALDGGNAYTQAELGFAYLRAGLAGLALGAFERAAALDPDNMTVQVELGQAYWRAGRFAEAAPAFERARQADPANPRLARQLVYVYQRLKQNDAARSYVKQVLDAPVSFTETPAPGDSRETAAAQRFGFQRLHEDLGRRVTVNLDGWSGTAVGAGTQAPDPGSHYRSYSQVEADFRIGNPPIRDGSTLSAYVRVLADGGDLRSAVPSQNAMIGLGMRWKPLRTQVIYLAMENQTGLDDQRRDVLLRASASFLNGGRYGDDWHPSVAGWFSRNLYLDAAQYLQTSRTAFTVDYRTSYHRRVSGNGTLEPYVHLQFNGTRTSRLERDLRTGVGVRWNIWYGATRYDAAPHKVSVGIEFQQALQTYLSDRNGLFVSVGSRW